ncbi:MAG: 7-cyano-7-deazaguanine synthase QueC [Legionellales bacterium]|nr:7-cyano-7-deazaguanine synthase QueC [Legionellales bacterium]
MKKKAVILLSGGLDSTTCLAYAKAKGYECFALSFDYAQRHRTELNAAKHIAQYFNVNEHKIIPLDLSLIGGSALTDKKMNIEKYSAEQLIPTTYVPARNTIFFSVALGYAEVINADYIITGISAVDYSGYPDCRPECLNAFQTMADYATKKGVMDKSIRFLAPLIYLTKAETIKLGTKLGVNYAMTVSCYQANAQGAACGECDSCVLRKQGFEKAQLADPTCYR